MTFTQPSPSNGQRNETKKRKRVIHGWINPCDLESYRPSYGYSIEILAKTLVLGRIKAKATIEWEETK